MSEASLKQEIEKLKKELAQKDAELQKLDKARTEFISLASHQLRTPLSATKWVIELLMEENLTREQKAQIVDLFHANERLINLVNDLLDVSRVESKEGRPELHPVRVKELLKEAIGELRAKAEKEYKEIRMKAEGEYEVMVDRMLFHEAFKNVLDNAIHYSADRSVIRVGLHTEKSNVVVSVHNEGSFISEEERGDIFTKFHRSGYAQEKNPEGSGLGLFIAKSAVEAMGGRIWFESSKEGGTTFFISVPAKKQ